LLGSLSVSDTLALLLASLALSLSGETFGLAGMPGGHLGPTLSLGSAMRGPETTPRTRHIGRHHHRSRAVEVRADDHDVGGQHVGAGEGGPTVELLMEPHAGHGVDQRLSHRYPSSRREQVAWSRMVQSGITPIVRGINHRSSRARPRARVRGAIVPGHGCAALRGTARD
jgi:hypothetical protein